MRKPTTNLFGTGVGVQYGLVLFRIDLARVASKYIGENKKSLCQIFDEAEQLNAVLLFGEADALISYL